MIFEKTNALAVKCALIASIFYGPFIEPLDAQEKEESVERIPLIAKKLTDLHDVLSSKQSLSVTAHASGTVDPKFSSESPTDFTATFKLFYKGKRFLYDVEFLSPKGPTYSQVESYDGEHYTLLNRNGGLWSISSRPFVYDVVMCQWHVFFMPFYFLQSGFSEEAFRQVSYDELTDKNDWQNIFGAITSPSEVAESGAEHKRYVKIAKIGKSIDPVSEQECSFDVYFAEGPNWYPVKWERRTLQGEIVSSYSVEEIGLIKLENDKSIQYPKTSVLKHYRDGEVRDTTRVEVSKIDFDSVSEDEISIDPASANRIRDLDNGVKFTVPH